MSREASGFPCPQCGEDDLAWVIEMRPPQMELQCSWCGYEWAVET